MFDVWGSIHQLGQPCLIRATTEPTIGSEGVVKDSIFRSIDSLLWEDVERAVLESRIRPFQHESLYTADKWLTTSALQKCIRRGHSELAERYARSSVQIDADHAFRRLAIIALEDVGLGDLKLVSTTLAILGNKPRRRSLGQERLAVHLAVQMSRAIKCRLACEMLSLIEYDAEAGKIADRLAGELHRTQGDDTHLLDMADIASRMMSVAARVHKISALPSEITDVLGTLFHACIKARSYVAFCHVADIAIGYDIFGWDRILKGAEEVVSDPEGQDYPMAVQGVWELAERGYAKLGDKDGQKRAQDAIVEQDLKMRDQVGQASAEAHWVRTAIDKLRQFGGNRERIAELRKELRELEEASLDDFAGIPYQIDLSELATGTIEVFKGLTLPDVLLQFAMLNRPQSKEKLEKDVDESSEKFVMSSLFAGSHADREGKVYAQTGTKPVGDADKTEWYKAQSLMPSELHRQTVVGGQIDPARRFVMSTFPLEQRHFMPIVYNSPFVENGYQHTFSLGFARMFQGDFISSANILIPQLENAIRYVLKNANAHSAKMMSDLTQDDRSLSSLLDHMREEMESVFGVDLVHEIDLLFNYRPGPALRHQAAHGKLTDGLCYSADAIYACWLIYQITVLQLVPYWKEYVGPQIEEHAY